MQLTTLAALVTLVFATAASSAPMGLDRRHTSTETSTSCRTDNGRTVCTTKTTKKITPDGNNNNNNNNNNENKGDNNNDNKGAQVIEIPAAPAPPANNNNNGGGAEVANLSEQDKQFLDLHNNFRAARQANALSWNTTLAEIATKQAKTCVFEHSKGKFGPTGENLADRAPNISPEQAFTSWGPNEEADFDPANPKFSHFTQVVWKASTQLGCAIVRCPAGSLFDAKFGETDYAVCEYFPPGNVSGQFGENVTKLNK